MDFATLIVSEEDGSDIYYTVSPQYMNLLEYINGQTYIFLANGIFDKKTMIQVSSKVADFLRKFRSGRYNENWKSIAERTAIIESNEFRSMCTLNQYTVRLTH